MKKNCSSCLLSLISITHYINLPSVCYPTRHDPQPFKSNLDWHIRFFLPPYPFSLELHPKHQQTENTKECQKIIVTFTQNAKNKSNYMALTSSPVHSSSQWSCKASKACKVIKIEEKESFFLLFRLSRVFLLVFIINIHIGERMGEKKRRWNEMNTHFQCQTTPWWRRQQVDANVLLLQCWKNTACKLFYMYFLHS